MVADIARIVWLGKTQVVSCSNRRMTLIKGPFDAPHQDAMYPVIAYQLVNLTTKAPGFDVLFLGELACHDA